MEDLTFGYSKPCIMDVKMGTLTAGENANFLKKSYMVKKDKKTTSQSLGLRLVASRVRFNFIRLIL
jgi:1D-myo-inositol-tetrakisphosphate 5-kinase/inositol-polyphosphate multikinase